MNPWEFKDNKIDAVKRGPTDVLAMLLSSGYQTMNPSPADP